MGKVTIAAWPVTSGMVPVAGPPGDDSDSRWDRSMNWGGMPTRAVPRGLEP
jgi:hypothetical protein